MSPERVIGVVQARMGSSRLPGKVMADIEGLPLVAWTLTAMAAVPGLETVVLATTTLPQDDQLVAAMAGVVPVHRGSARDVLERCWDAVVPYAPTIVVRQTADNPFVDPDVTRSQVDRLISGGFDFVGNSGWPLGIASEVARAAALGQAALEATRPAEREHVMPFLYARPKRFRIGTLTAPLELVHHRYTIDTPEDLHLVRAISERLGHGPPVRLAEIEAIMRADPDWRRSTRAFARSRGSSSKTGADLYQGAAAAMR